MDQVHTGSQVLFWVLMQPRRPWLAIVLVSGLTLQSGAAADQTHPVELAWSELSATIAGQTVELMLPDGTAVAGKATLLRTTELVMDIGRSSNTKLHPKGGATIPRAEISTLTMKRVTGKAAAG